MAHPLDGIISSFLLFKVDKAIALAVAACIRCDLAAQNVAKGIEGVMQGLVVDALIKVFDENVAHA